MANNDLPKLIQDLLYGQSHRIMDDDIGRAVVESVRAGVADDFVCGIITNRVQRHKIAQAFAGPFQLPHLHHGGLSPGLDQRGRLILFPIQFLNGHTITLGGSGCGKTTRIIFLVFQIASKVRGLWLFDLRKREFAVLRSYLARLGIDLIVVPGRKLRLNPLQVPAGVETSDWAPRIAEVLVQVLGLPPRATKLLHTTLLHLYRKYGTLDDPHRCPCMFDLYEAIASDRQANPQAREATLDSLEPVLMSLRSVLCYRRAWTTEELARRQVVFELGGLAETDKNLILNTLLLGEFSSRIARGISNPRMNLWICCDEAQRLASSTNPSSGITDLIGLVRGTGIGLDLSVQSSDVAPAVLSNTANKFIGRCGSATDYDTVGTAMGLTVEQRRWLALNLRPGLFVGQVGEGDWRQPFLCQVPPMQLTAQGHAHRAESGLDALLGLPTEPASEYVDWQPRGSRSFRANPSMSSPNSSSESTSLSEADLRYLRAVVDHPGLPSSRYPKLAKIGPRKAQKLRQRLVELGYLREHNVNTGRRGRAAIVLEPTELARGAVAEPQGGGPA